MLRLRADRSLSNWAQSTRIMSIARFWACAASCGGPERVGIAQTAQKAEKTVRRNITNPPQRETNRYLLYSNRPRHPMRMAAGRSAGRGPVWNPPASVLVFAWWLG